jgi:hypothetical protein
MLWVHDVMCVCVLFSSTHVLRSLSAARRAQARSRWIIGCTLLAVGGLAAWAAVRYVKPFPLPAWAQLQRRTTITTDVSAATDATREEYAGAAVKVDRGADAHA